MCYCKKLFPLVHVCHTWSHTYNYFQKNCYLNIFHLLRAHVLLGKKVSAEPWYTVFTRCIFLTVMLAIVTYTITKTFPPHLVFLFQGMTSRMSPEVSLEKKTNCVWNVSSNKVTKRSSMFAHLFLLLSVMCQVMVRYIRGCSSAQIGSRPVKSAV